MPGIRYLAGSLERKRENQGQMRRELSGADETGNIKQKAR